MCPQEMRLLEAAYDGDVEGVSGALETGVPVDVALPVRPYTSCLYIYTMEYSADTTYPKKNHQESSS